jgi:putative sterol carrier protein
MDLLLTLPSLLPAAAHLPVWNLAPAAFSLLAHTWCTNVAAMPVPVYVLGHELKHVYGYFPLNPSMGLASVIVSYNGRISMTLVADRSIIKDVDVLERYLNEAYVELTASIPDKKPVQPVPAEPSHLPSIEPGHLPLVEPGHPPSNGLVRHVDGSSDMVKLAPEVPAAGVELMQQPALALSRECHKLFSEGWAKTMQEEINQSEDYRSASTRWTAGSLAFVMEAAPDHGFETPAAVWFDLYRGVCRSARALSAQEAMRESAFVIQGAHSAWMDVLSGRAAPFVMLTNGRLKLKKGALLSLLPHTRSAAELVRCAQHVPWDE